MARGVLGIVTGIFTVGLALACGGGRSGAPAPVEPVQVGSQTAPPKPAGKLRFGKPSSWTQDKQQYKDEGHPVVHYTLSGQAATVQITLHPQGVEPPDPLVELANFQQTLRDQLPDGLAFDEPLPHTRTLGDSEVTGLIQGMTIRAPDAVIHGEHRSYVVRGPTTSALVVVDVPDAAHPTADAQVEEVLGNLRLP